ncbi:MAG: hypothetical protein Q8M76_06865, partial [Spirochaetaceae bacterium]|nr:hypothetical protein [Spirochaetaceae bacterium]
MDEIKRKSWFAFLAFPLFLGLILGSVFVFRDQFISIFRDREAIRTWVEGKGPWGPLLFMGLQVLQVVVFVVPGEIVQVAGGYVFGMWLGAFYSIVGLCAGSALNFLV